MNASADIQSAIAALLEAPGALPVAAQFDYEVEFRRANPLVIQLAAALGYDTASRTDGVNANGAVYNASYWPQYAKNSAPYNPAMDGVNIHPSTATYTAIENYLGPLLATL